MTELKETGSKATEQMKSEQSIKHLVRILNTDLDGFKPVRQALLKIKGIGVSFATMICVVANIDKNKKIGTLPETEVKKLDEAIRHPLKHNVPSWMLNRRKDYETSEDRHILTGDLIFTRDNDIKRLRKIKSYRGNRHARGLPSRGQRTRSNFRKNKGKVRLGVQRKKTKQVSAAKKPAVGKKK
jgi:small subunit ribosomal protein S13